MPRHITEYVLYRWRYQLGYAIVGLMVAGILIAAAFYVPGGLSKAEMASVAATSHLSLTSFDPASVIDLPYKLLQSASFALLGVTTLSIKLPSVILGLFSLIGIVFLLRHWFHMNVAIIAALIVITSSQFIFTSQHGTPTIMYIFLPTWLLLLALKVSRQTKRRNFWEFLLVTALALSLYTPLSAYIILALISATMLHPHLRFIVRRLSKMKLFAAGMIGLVFLAPLIAALVTKPEVGLALLGVPDTWPNVKETGLELVQTYFGFLFVDPENGRPQSAYTLPSLLLLLIGIVHLLRAKYTARSYVIVCWILLLAPIVLINPSKTVITFVPVMLLIAAGIDELLHRWYRLFPRNPYARVAGLFPISLLVIGMALTGTERYFYSYRYTPSVASAYSDDLSLLNSELSQADASKVSLIIASEEAAFYEAVARHNPKIAIINHEGTLPEGQPRIVTRSAFYARDMGKTEPAKIITNGKSSESDRFYLYKSGE